MSLPGSPSEALVAGRLTATPDNWASLRPFARTLTAQIALVFLAISLLTRLALFGLSLNVAGAHIGNWVAAFLTGFLSDCATLSLALLPVALFDLLLPRRWPRLAAVLRGGAFGFITFTLIFQAASEFIFWQEFGSRFNFIAVDYLVYTREVLDNIVQSYPVVPLVLLFAVAALALAVLWRQKWKNASALPARIRAITLSALTVLAVLFWFGWSAERSAITHNHYANELAANGLYNFFSAYRNNQLNYASHYPTLSGHEITQEMTTLGIAPAFSGAVAPVAAALPTTPKHVVMITVESLSADYLGSFGNAQGLTPNLDKLAKEGLLFTNLYAAGTRTVRGLEALSLSVPPTPGQSIVRRPKNENLATLGAALNRDGYHSWYLYGGYGYFDNMNYYFSHNGYEVVDHSDIPNKEIGFANAWGMSDEYLFNKAEKLLDQEAAKGPQFLMLMTTSNHRPYTYPEGRIDIRSPGGRDGAVKYTDYAIGKFIAEAQHHSWFKDTVFMIVADHCASSAGKTSLPVWRYHIPAIIYAPGTIQPREETRMVSQIDMAPTLLGILGLPAEPHFFGKDVLNSKDYAPRALIANYQEVGYLQGDQLVVLAPHQPVRQYRVENSSGEKEKQTEVKPDAKLVREAIAYYQGASEGFSNGKMQLAEKDIARHVPARN